MLPLPMPEPPGFLDQVIASPIIAAGFVVAAAIVLVTLILALVDVEGS
jgi:hypothetical protein